MFEGQKTIIFWIGLIILGLASVSLFTILWMIAVWNGYMDRFTMLKQAVPVIVGGVVFILIGLYMMKSGAKTKPEKEEKAEENTKPEKDLDDPEVVSRVGALLDFYSDRAVAHASFFVASIFGLVTASAIIQELQTDSIFVWLSTLVFFAFSYMAYFTLVRFGFYAEASDELIFRACKKEETLEGITFKYKGKDTNLKEHLEELSKRKDALLLLRKILRHPTFRKISTVVKGGLYWSFFVAPRCDCLFKASRIYDGLDSVGSDFRVACFISCSSSLHPLFEPRERK